MHMRKHQRRFVHREESFIAKSQAQMMSLKRWAAIIFYVVFALCSVGFWYYHRRSKVLAGMSNERNVGHTYTLLETGENSDSGTGEGYHLYGADGVEIMNMEHSGTSVSKIEFDLNKEMRSKFKYLN